MRKTLIGSAIFVLSASATVLLSGAGHGQPPYRPDRGHPAANDSRVQQGFEIAPVPLSLHGKNPALVGLGSYLVNAVASCADCHSCPTYAPGHSPYAGGDGALDAEHYLAGGVPFGPFISANLTPDENGLPAGLTRDEFIQTLRTGQDPDDPEELLQVMPWPILRNMTDHDLGAIYEYLSAIPAAQSGVECAGAGE
jgi:hypothetical protein